MKTISFNTPIFELVANNIISVRVASDLRVLEIRNIMDAVNAMATGKISRNGGAKMKKLHDVMSSIISKLDNADELVVKNAFDRTSAEFQNVFSKCFEIVMPINEVVANVIKAKFAEPWMLFECLTTNPSETYAVQPSLDKAGNIEYRKFFLDFIKILAGYVEVIPEGEMPVAYYQFDNLASLLKQKVQGFTFANTAKYFMTNEAKECFKAKYLRMAKVGMQRQAYLWAMRQFDENYDIINIIDLPLSEYSQLHTADNRLGVATMRNLYEFHQDHMDELTALMNVTENDIAMNMLADDINVPNAVAAEICAFKAKHGYVPAFRSVYESLSHSANKYDKMFLAYAYEGMSFDEIAGCYGMTFERIRQIMDYVMPERIKKILGGYALGVYGGLFRGDFFALNGNDITKVASTEGCTPASVAKVLVAACGYKLYNIDGAEFILSSEYSNVLTVAVLRKAMNQFRIQKFDCDTMVNVASYIEPEIRNYVSTSVFAFLVASMGYVVENGMVLRKQNYINVVKEACAVLEAKANLMSAEDIRTEIDAKFLGTGLKLTKSFKAKIVKSGVIKPVGRKGLYGLASWNRSYCSIPEAAVNVLRKVASTMPIYELADKVCNLLPWTNRRNVVASLRADACDRFFFNNNYIGLCIAPAA